MRTLNSAAILICAIFGLYSTACEKIETPQNDLTYFDNASRYVISQQDALDRSLEFVNYIGDESTRSAEPLQVADCSVIYPSNTTRSDGNINPICYLFNFQDDRGYVLASADERMKTPVLVYEESGNLYTDHASGTPLEVILNLIESYYESSVADYEPVETTRVNEDDYYYVITREDYGVQPLIDTRWNQAYPYNMYLAYTPYAAANAENGGLAMGCGPVAMGQVLAYYRKPSSITGRDGITYTFDWEAIHSCKQYRYGDIVDNIWAIEVSKFLYAVGSRLKAKYGNETSTDFADIKTELNTLGYSCSGISSYSYGDIATSLGAGCPVLIRATCNYATSDCDGKSGHAWIIDGYKGVYEEYRCYNADGTPKENTILEDYNYITEHRYLHCNFGWGGASDGYFMYYSYFGIIGQAGMSSPHIYEEIFDTTRSNADFKDISPENHHYYKNIKVIYNIKPNN